MATATFATRNWVVRFRATSRNKPGDDVRLMPYDFFRDCLIQVRAIHQLCRNALPCKLQSNEMHETGQYDLEYLFIRLGRRKRKSRVRPK